MKAPLKFTILAALAAAVIAAVAFKPTRAKAPAAAIGGPAAAIAAAKLPKLIDVGASKCIPCKMMAPILEGLKTEYAGRMNVEFIDVWQNPEAGKQYGIEMIPTQIFYDAEGQELFRHAGFFAKDDILGKWKELGVDVTTNPPSSSKPPQAL